MVIPANLPFFRIKEEPSIKHYKEDSLNLEEDLKERLLNDEQKKTLRRNINSKKQELGQFFFMLMIHTTFKIYKDSLIQN